MLTEGEGRQAALGLEKVDHVVFSAKALANGSLKHTYISDLGADLGEPVTWTLVRSVQNRRAEKRF